MGALWSVGLLLLGLGVGLFIGYGLGSRRVTALRQEHARRKTEIRSHVLPLLEQRASTTGVPADKRARDVIDPVIASIAIARAIQEIDSKRDLPYTDTLEVSKEEIRSSTGTRRRG